MAQLCKITYPCNDNFIIINQEGIYILMYLGEFIPHYDSYMYNTYKLKL